MQRRSSWTLGGSGNTDGLDKPKRSSNGHNEVQIILKKGSMEPARVQVNYEGFK